MSTPEQHQFDLEHEAPLLHLITKDPSTMTDKELIDHSTHLNTLRTSAQTQKATIKNKPKGPKRDYSDLLK